MTEDPRRETGLIYFVVISRGRADLHPMISDGLGPYSHFHVFVDRRRPASNHAVARPPSSGPGVPVAIPPTQCHMVIRQDCAHLYEDLEPAFAGRREIYVLVDRRSRSRTPSRPRPETELESRRTDPPVWVV